LTPFSIVLVLISALIHSSWNFFTKRGNWPLEFFFWVFLGGTLLFLPFFFALSDFPALLFRGPSKFWYLSMLSGFIQTIYFICLIEAYRVGDLSIVYPVSRSAPLFTLIWAVLFIGEILSVTGTIGIGLVIVGIFVISLRDFHLRSIIQQSKHFASRAYLLAFISAITGSIYSVIDKVGVQLIHPAIYTWLIDLWMCIYIGVYLFFHNGGSFRNVWQESKRDILIIAILQNAAYLLVLMALRMSKVSYVVAFRQVGALFGAGMGIFFLKESHWKTRITGALILTFGLLLIGLAR
jgi:uncharacterized membrane protein